MKNSEDMIARFDTIHERERQTDGRTDTACQHRSRLCVASGVKKRCRSILVNAI